MDRSNQTATPGVLPENMAATVNGVNHVEVLIVACVDARVVPVAAAPLAGAVPVPVRSTSTVFEDVDASAVPIINILSRPPSTGVMVQVVPKPSIAVTDTEVGLAGLNATAADVCQDGSVDAPPEYRTCPRVPVPVLVSALAPWLMGIDRAVGEDTPLPPLAAESGSVTVAPPIWNVPAILTVPVLKVLLPVHVWFVPRNGTVPAAAGQVTWLPAIWNVDVKLAAELKVAVPLKVWAAE